MYFEDEGCDFVSFVGIVGVDLLDVILLVHTTLTTSCCWLHVLNKYCRCLVYFCSQCCSYPLHNVRVPVCFFILGNSYFITTAM